jgi:hypothetical protein
MSVITMEVGTISRMRKIKGIKRSDIMEINNE